LCICAVPLATGDQDEILVEYFQRSCDIAFYFGSVLAGAWWTNAHDLLDWKKQSGHFGRVV
jgi:hypothetical protein